MKKLQFIVGTEVYYDAHELEQPVRIDKATGSAFGSSQVDDSTNKNLINPGAYIQANWLAWDPYARLTAGVRYDWHNIYGSQVAGRGGIVSHWGKRRRVTTKLLYGSAFKAPSPLLLFATPLRPGDIVGNAKLDPQVVHAVESQIAWSRRKEFRISTGVTYSLLRNKAEFRPQGINITAQNVSSHHGLSWESRADFSHRKWLLGYVGFDLQRGFRVIDQEGYVASLVGRANVVHPLWIARGGLDFNVDKARLAFMTEAMVVGQRRAADANIVENGGDYDLDAYPVINAGIRTHDFRLFGRGLTRFSINGYNITNNTTPDPGFAAYDYPRLPLEVMVKVTHFHR
jgi:iron complex outermembrane receptor protein